MSNFCDNIFDFWKKHHQNPFHFPMEHDVWETSMYEDVDSDGCIAYLRWIYVDENQQHRGIGTAVMKALFSELYEMGIRRFDTDTARSNLNAQAYYEKCGFTNEGITRSYYTA